MDHVLPVITEVSDGWLDGGAARELRGDDEVGAVRRDSFADQCFGNAVLIIVSDVDKVAACVGESGDDAVDFFRSGSVAPGLTEHPVPSASPDTFNPVLSPKILYRMKPPCSETILAVYLLTSKYAL
ncbi:MAG: hypothetical protein JWO19_3066 [Bryobacterales bacterium]|nr:hypothetical protein [Bryobacterales bacterium]